MRIRFWAGLSVLLAACGGTSGEPGASAGPTEATSGASSGKAAGTGGAGGSGGVASATGSGGALAGATTGAGGGPSGSAATAAVSSSGGPPDSGPPPSQVTVFVAPDTSLVGDLVSAIEAATTSVHMTMYILDNSKIVDALVNRRQAGLDVRVVLNQTFPAGTVETNPATYSTLQAAGIGVVWRSGPPGAAAGAYTHEKTFLLDGKQAWIMTMNLDTTAPLDNREYVVLDETPADVQEADAIFLADYAGTATALGDPLVVSPDNSRAALVALINAATTTLDVEAEEFSDAHSNGVVDAVAAAAKRGVTTRLTLANATPVAAQTTAVATVKAAGAKVVVSGGTSGNSTAGNPYLHAKAIVIDCAGTTCARGYLGSENFTAGSLGYNRELGLVLDDPTALAKVKAAIDTDFAKGKAQ